MMRTLQQSRRNQDVSAKMGARAKVRTISFFFQIFSLLTCRFAIFVDVNIKKKTTMISWLYQGTH